jgi:uncharacterized protein (TIGR02996 family)
VSNWIEPAKTARSKCVTCDQIIDKGAPRLSEETSDIGIPTLIHRYYHLRCALATVPDVLRRALADIRGNVEIEDRAGLEAKLSERLAFETAKRREKYEAQLAEREATAPVVASDPITLELTEQLLDDPDDPGALAVLADQLQGSGDPRGELIAIQLALAGAPRSASLDDEDDDDGDPDYQPDPRDAEIRAQLRRRAVLFERLALPLDPNDRVVWGIGFLRRLELVGKTGTRLSDQIAIWRNPSLRLLAELQVTFAAEHDANWTSRLVDVIPKSLRRLELGRSTGHPLPGLHDLVASLPRLNALSIVGRPAFEKLAHPTLIRLELGLVKNAGQFDLGSIIPLLSKQKLPELTELAVHSTQPRDTSAICHALVSSGWLPRLTHLGIHGALGEGIELLADGLGTHKLTRLDLTRTPIRVTLRDKLAKLADEVIMPDVIVPEIAPGDTGVLVEHRNRPEWGQGRLIRRFEGKLEIEFEEAGTKVFKADAPFLRILGS